MLDCVGVCVGLCWVGCVRLGCVDLDVLCWVDGWVDVDWLCWVLLRWVVLVVGLSCDVLC